MLFVFSIIFIIFSDLESPIYYPNMVDILSIVVIFIVILICMIMVGFLVYLDNKKTSKKVNTNKLKKRGKKNMKFKKIVKRFSLIFYMSFAFVSMLFMGYIFTMEIFYGKAVFIEPNLYISTIELTIVVFTMILFMYWTVKFLKTVPIEVVD
nr:MAG: hypothetical protein [uncultured archaeon]